MIIGGYYEPEDRSGQTAATEHVLTHRAEEGGKSNVVRRKPILIGSIQIKRFERNSYMCRTCLRNIMFLSSLQYPSDPVTAVCTNMRTLLTGMLTANANFNGFSEVICYFLISLF